MEFGKVPPQTVSSIDFTLPADGKQTSKILDSEPEKADVFIGCAKWGLPEWVNFLYPPGTKSPDFLNEYAKHFNSIELNSAHYHIPSFTTVHKWKNQVAEGAADKRFLFCPKFPESISHKKRLKDAEAETSHFLDTLIAFEDHLGPCFLQLSDSFGPENFSLLESYLRSLPPEMDLFVELRNHHWFDDPIVRKDVFEMFTALHKGAVLTDVSGRRDVLHMEVTVPETLIRFVGNGAAFREQNFKRIDEWVQRLKLWQDNGLKKVYFFVHQHDERETIRMGMHAVKAFNAVLGSNVPEIQIQPSLF